MVLSWIKKLLVGIAREREREGQSILSWTETSYSKENVRRQEKDFSIVSFFKSLNFLLFVVLAMES